MVKKKAGTVLAGAEESAAVESNGSVGVSAGSSAVGVPVIDLGSVKKVSDYAEGELLELDPESVEYPEELEVRPFRRAHGLTEDELEFVGNLAVSIQEEGQIHPILVVKRGEKIIGLTGQTRCMAISQINAGMSKNEKPMMVKAVMGEMPASLTRAFKLSVRSNNQRPISAMDMALDIKQVRDNAPGMKTVAKLAEYFQTSPATVTQHLKLLELSEDLQVKVHTGELSRDAAFALLDVKPEKRAEVVEMAKGLVKAEVEGGGAIEPEAIQSPSEDSASAKPKSKKAKNTGTIKARSVKEAARETPGATDKPQPRTRKELVAWAEENQGPAYGYPNGSIHKFFRAFVSWSKGEISTRTLDKWFGEMIVKADRGKPEPKKADEPKSKK